MQDHVSDENFILYAAKHYENTACLSEDEFNNDLSKIKYISKMFNRYESDGRINERLILNHLRMLYNVFNHEAMTKMLFLKLKKHLHLLKPFLIMLSYWPEQKLILGEHIFESDIQMDLNIVQALRKI